MNENVVSFAPFFDRGKVMSDLEEAREIFIKDRYATVASMSGTHL